ncbi:75_t:CDS:2 [Scutellospora calospora]|uniref:75_t:CDS:1 n=1 Tax=Scutellospora calospora TaxID=85575 RepID=A0ACA9K4P8_9GLOM|nr:75_t:CDS:2 [Scutellospora calospora]
MELPSATCVECEKALNVHSWCCRCQNEGLRQNFKNWTSDDIKTDELIQITQLDAKKCMGYLEWIPFDNLDHTCIKFIASGSFSSVYSSIWFDGPRNIWCQEDTDWIRNGPIKCALKKFEDSQTLSKEFFDKILKHHQYLYGDSVADFFGVTRDSTGCIIFVMTLYDGNLYQYIDNFMENICWENVILMLQDIIDGLKQIHKDGLYHGNLHGGNLLVSDSHDLNLAERIYDGLRPEIITDTPEVFLLLMERCWHPNPELRPNAIEISNNLTNWIESIQNDPSSMISKQFLEAKGGRSILESRTINPMAIYNSRTLNFQPLRNGQ